MNDNLQKEYHFKVISKIDKAGLASSIQSFEEYTPEVKEIFESVFIEMFKERIDQLRALTVFNDDMVDELLSAAHELILQQGFIEQTHTWQWATSEYFKIICELTNE